MIRRILFGILALLVLAAIFFIAELRNPKISDNPENHDIIKVESPQNEDFIVAISLAKARFRVSEPIPITIYVRNNSKEDGQLYFVSSQKFDIVVKDAAGTKIWRWSRGKVFTMAIEQIQVAAGKQAVFSQTWNQAGDDGTQILAGKYVIEVTCKAQQTPNPAVANIEVVP